MILRRELLKAVRPAVDDQDATHRLDAIEVQPDGRAVATDGHVLLIATDRHPMPDADYPVIPSAPYKGDPAGAIMIDVAIVDSILAAMPKKSPIPILHAAQLTTNETEGGAVLSATDLQAPRSAHVQPSSERVGGQFPSWRRVLPKDDGSKAVYLTLGVEVLDTLLKAARAIEGAGRGGKRDRSKLTAITFEIRTGAQHQGRTRPTTTYEAFPDDVTGEGRCQHCGLTQDKHTGATMAQGDRCPGKPDGHIVDAVAFYCEPDGSDVTIDGVAMPCRLPEHVIERRGDRSSWLPELTKGGVK